MSYFTGRRAWCAIALTCLVWSGSAANLYAGTLISPGTLDVIRKSAEPFGQFATEVLWESRGVPSPALPSGCLVCPWLAD